MLGGEHGVTLDEVLTFLEPARPPLPDKTSKTPRKAAEPRQRAAQGRMKARQPEPKVTVGKVILKPLTAAEHRERADQRRAAAEARRAATTCPGQCEGLTKAGRRCRLPADGEGGRCSIHRDQARPG